MPTKLRPWGGRATFDGNDGLLNKLSRLSEAQTTGTRSVGWQQALMDTLEAACRSVANPFGDAATLDTGTTEGTVPVLGAGGLLSNARLPRTLPASSVTSGTFLTSQIPRFFAGERRPGFRGVTGRVSADRLYDTTRTPPVGLPASKIGSGRLTADQLPVGYAASRRVSPTTFGPGGPGVQDADGTTIGRDEWTVGTVRPPAENEQESEMHTTQGTVSADGLSAKIQFRSDYVRNGYNAGAWTGGEPPPDSLKIPPEPDPGGPGDPPDMPQPPTNGNGNNPPPPDG